MMMELGSPVQLVVLYWDQTFSINCLSSNPTITNRTAPKSWWGPLNSDLSSKNWLVFFVLLKIKSGQVPNTEPDNQSKLVLILSRLNFKQFWCVGERWVQSSRILNYDFSEILYPVLIITNNSSYASNRVREAQQTPKHKEILYTWKLFYFTFSFYFRLFCKQASFSSL
jgi:hypothetical protein